MVSIRGFNGFLHPPFLSLTIHSYTKGFFLSFPFRKRISRKENGAGSSESVDDSPRPAIRRRSVSLRQWVRPHAFSSLLSRLRFPMLYPPDCTLSHFSGKFFNALKQKYTVKSERWFLNVRISAGKVRVQFGSISGLPLFQLRRSLPLYTGNSGKFVTKIETTLCISINSSCMRILCLLYWDLMLNQEKRPWIAHILVVASLSLAAKMRNSDLSISLSDLQVWLLIQQNEMLLLLVRKDILSNLRNFDFYWNREKTALSLTPSRFVEWREFYSLLCDGECDLSLLSHFFNISSLFWKSKTTL